MINKLSRFQKIGLRQFVGASALFSVLVSNETLAQSCEGAADIWFANDESGSVDNTEMVYALDFFYKVADEFLFEEIEGAKAAAFGWSVGNGPIDYVLPASAGFGDVDDTGYLDPNGDGDPADSNIVTDSDGAGIREAYVARTYSGGTWLAKATNDLASRIGNNTDSNADGTTDNGRRSGIPQIAVLLTDAFDSQLTTAGSGAEAGQLGGSDWDTAIANLVVTAGGTKMVLMLIDEAADAYNNDAATTALIDSFVTNYDVSLFVGDTYAAIADPVNNYISGLSSTICLLTDVVTRLQAPGAFSGLDTFAVTIEFSEDMVNFDVSDLVIGNGTASNLVQISASTYTVDLTPDGSQSDITVDVPAAVADTGTGRDNRASQQAIVQYDSDNDFIGDGDEGLTTDTDGDGVFDYLDLDSDNDGIADAFENGPNGEVDSDGDGVADYLDLDSDADGVLDLWESGSATALTLDANGDGRIDLTESFGTDGLADALQSGGDGGALNYTVADTDADGLSDFRDLDSDADSLADLVESGISGSDIATLDTDSNGTIDSSNAVGTDGIVDSLQSNVDGNPVTHTLADTDGDTAYDFRDLDTDNDGIPDLIESGNSAAIALDVNDNGVIDSGEATVGTDGIADAAQGGSDAGALPDPSNSDAGNETGDPIADFRDLDSDNDGLTDVLESGGSDTYGFGLADGSDANGDGLIDAGFVVDPIDTAPSDSPDYQNVDSNGANPGDDNDSDAAANGFDTAPNDGVLDDTTDSDGDGLADSLDQRNGHGTYADPALLVTETGGDSAVFELGASNSDTLLVRLNRPPVSSVELTVSVVDGTEASLDLGSLTFNSSDWFTNKTLTVTGIDDGFVDGDQATSISTVVNDAASSNEFDGLSESVALAVFDNTSDSDGDGISDSQEGGGDVDGDGIADADDLDSDNDGIPDSVEAGNDPFNLIDTDGDGTPDYRELDSDNDGVVDYLEVGTDPNNPVDSDGDGLADYIDRDSDADGIPDSIEDRNSPTLADQDVIGAGPGGNGIDDALDVLVTGGSDDNGNGVDDALEPSDDDVDNKANHLDLDSDGDGILDIVEAANLPTLAGTDSDQDGIDDALDVDQTGGTDANNDGIDDALAPRDSDGDGVPDFLDRDSDNDGIEDSLEAAIVAALIGADGDGDGIDDAVDIDVTGGTDSNGNGIDDAYEVADRDGDGVPDYLDLDSDADGITDLAESGSTVSQSLDTDSNGRIDDSAEFGLDGLADALQIDGDGGDLNYTVVDTDGDAIADFRDLDSDNDALSDLVESGLSQALVSSLDADGDGDIDSPAENAAHVVSNDGLVDSLQAGADGNAYDHLLVDTDADSIADFRDLDSDSDGIPDLIESGNTAALALDADNSGALSLAEASVGNDGIADAAQGGVDGGALPLPSNSDAANETGAVIPDFRDLDSDNDGLTDVDESGAADVNRDAAADGEDANNDGLVDVGFVTNPVDSVPTDSPDYRNPDSNGATAGDDNDSDPILSALDVVPNDGVLDNTQDSDGDGIPDSADDFNGHGVTAQAEVLTQETDGSTVVNETGVGNTDTVLVVLRAQPSADVLVLVALTDADEASLAPSQLTFTPANWNQAQAVTATGLDDGWVDGNQTLDLVLTVDASSASEYQGLTASVDLTVIDTTLDSDGDGLADALEGNEDSDGDGLPDSLDDDSDNDGIPDAVEVGSNLASPADSDGDGLFDYLDLDTDNDGVVDYLETGSSPGIPDDTDVDGIANFLDLDTDSDGIPDALEDHTSPVLSDLDAFGSGDAGNGIDDAIDVLASLGTDSNNDGIDDALAPSDDDGDLLYNHRDLDSDGDGILDAIEADNMPALSGADSDGDGIDDALDVDLTGGLDRNNDGADDALAPRDTDGDGVPDFYDLDSDNDGIGDALEGFLVAPIYANMDSDGDGIDDALDADNGGPVTDTNNNGISDEYEPVDTDGDGLPDYRDLDSDNDSLSDISESGDLDANGDGLIDELSAQASTLVPTDSDNDQLANYRDLESNNALNDGAGPFDISQSLTGNAELDIAPEDGVVDDLTDLDSDGVADIVDAAPHVFGLGVIPGLITDTDGDGLANALDLDADNDGIPNSAEGYDELAPESSVDTDADGIPDYLDLDSDNDGLFDLLEATVDAVDADANGLVDGFTDELPSPVRDGLHDTIATDFVPVDTDQDGVPDFRDLDSDDDGLNDLLETIANLEESEILDTDGDGMVDSIDALTGLPMDKTNQLLALSYVDSDSDGKPNFRDLDSDGDGFDDAIEATDADGDGTLDALVGRNGGLETSVSGSGSMGYLTLIALLGVAVRRRWSAQKVSWRWSLLIPVALLAASSVKAETDCGVRAVAGKTEFQGCWYAGVGAGWAHIDPEGESNGWRTDKDQSGGFEITLGRHFKPHWFAELKYANLGSAGLGNDNPLVDELYPGAEIEYKAPSLMVGYFLYDEPRTFNPYIKLGGATIKNRAEDSGGTVDFDEVTNTQFAFGMGLQIAKQDEPVVVRLNFDTYDRDAWFFSFSAHYRFKLSGRD